jgi:Skp family chaperone for outer membrane proteins
MLKKIQERIFPFVIALAALSVSASAAFYSVTGLSKLFAGASFEVMIMAGSLEAAKLVIASLLYQYRKTLPKVLKGYLTAACLVLILITSMGIYGFLSAAYQETASKSGMVDAEIVLIETKRDNVSKQLETYNLEKENLDKAIADLRKGLANNVITYTDENGNQVTTTSSSTRRALERQLDQSNERQSNLNTKIDELNTQLFNYENEILEVKSSSDIAGELGPLKYLSGLTGWPMDKIINILLLIIIFVFDPLAIALVVAANYAFEQLKVKRKENIYGEKVEVKDEGASLYEQAKHTPWENEADESHDLDVVLNGMAKNIEVEDEPDPSFYDSIEEKNKDIGSYSTGYMVSEEDIQKEDIEDFDDDGINIDETKEELEEELKNIPKARKYGPKGWKTIQQKLELLRKNKNDDDDLTIKY